MIKFVASIVATGLLTSCTPEPVVDKVESQKTLKLAVLLDKSGSTSKSITPQMSLEEARTAIALVSDRGGEVAFGPIGVRSNAPLLRLRIDRPPVEPIAPDKNQNAWKLDKQRRAYASEMETFKVDFERWKAARDEAISGFETRLRPLLAQKANAPGSDIFGGLQRATLFLSEGDVEDFGSVRKVIILVSDGIDNRKQPYEGLPGDIEFLLVNGSASIGSLAKFKPLRFESIPAAIRSVTVDSTAPVR